MILSKILSVTTIKLGSQLLALSRHALAAYVLSPIEFGIASVFMLLIAIADAFSNMSADKYLVTTENKELKKKLSAAHTINCVRSLLTGVIIYFYATDIARIFDIPEVVGFIELLSLIVMLRGLDNLSVKLLQRYYEYNRAAFTELIGQVLGFISVAVMLYFEKSSSSVLYAIFVQQITFLLATHLLAKNNYALSFDFDFIKKQIHYGWPLLLSGIFVFLNMHGEKLIVGAAISVKELGVLNAAMLITITPVVLFGGVVNSVAVSIIANNKVNMPLHRKVIESVNVFMVFYAAACMLMANILLEHVFGEYYKVDQMVLVCLVLIGGIKILKYGFGVFCLAFAETRVLLTGSIIRVSGFLVILTWFYFSSPSIYNILAVGVVFEIISCVYLSYKVNGFSGLSYVYGYFAIFILMQSISIYDFEYIDEGLIVGLCLLSMVVFAIRNLNNFSEKILGIVTLK